MANPHRGDVDIEADGETYTLRYTSNAVAQLENRFDASITKIAARLNSDDVRVGDLIGVFWGGLWYHHRHLTEENAGDILDAVGHDVAGRAIIEAFRLAYPEKRGDDTARPPKAKGRSTR